jgi:DNA-binding transcriptional MerR regulator
MVSKSKDAFRTISEVADDLDLPQHVLRFWETRFAQIKPMKRGGGRRYYRPDDVELLRGIRFLRYGEGYTIRGVQRILKEQGPRFVIAAGRGEFTGVPGRRDGGNLTDDDVADDLPAGGEERRRVEPSFRKEQHAAHAAPAFDVDREDHDPDGEAAGDNGGVAGAGRRPIGHLTGGPGAAARPGGLSAEDAERLQGTLAELLELKRLLDQAR